MATAASFLNEWQAAGKARNDRCFGGPKPGFLFLGWLPSDVASGIVGMPLGGKSS